MIFHSWIFGENYSDFTKRFIMTYVKNESQKMAVFNMYIHIYA